MKLSLEQLLTADTSAHLSGGVLTLADGTTYNLHVIEKMTGIATHLRRRVGVLESRMREIRKLSCYPEEQS